MTQTLESVAKALHLELTPTESPTGSGEWVFLFSKFGRRGFARLIARTDEPVLMCHFVLPGWSLADAKQLAAQVEAATDLATTATDFEGGFALTSSVVGDWGPIIGCLTRIADFVDTNLDPGQVLERVFSTSAPTAETETRAAEAAFEVIGDVADRPAIVITRNETSCAVVLNVGTAPYGTERHKIAAALRRHLRVRVDADVEIGDSGSVACTLTPASWSDGDVERLHQQLVEAMQPLNELIDAGMSPLPLLGIGSVDTIERHAPRVDEERVVFGAGDAALKPGDFEDTRLREADTNEALVDVVLRHPGYSDRRVGQVISILMSIEYHAALQLMNNAPTVIARGVAADRGASFKEVIERAGGLVQLTAPGRYPVS